MTQNQAVYLHKRAKPLCFSLKMHRNEMFQIWKCSFPLKLFLICSLLFFFPLEIIINFNWKWQMKEENSCTEKSVQTTPFFLMPLIPPKTLMFCVVPSLHTTPFSAVGRWLDFIVFHRKRYSRWLKLSFLMVTAASLVTDVAFGPTLACDCTVQHSSCVHSSPYTHISYFLFSVL